MKKFILHFLLLFLINDAFTEIRLHPLFADHMVVQRNSKVADLYNPKVGTILSWPGMIKKMNWPHNTIIDNMLNLEMLFKAHLLSGRKEYYDMAVKHAEITMNKHFREDLTTYHVVVYDPESGKKIKGVTHQGYSDDSLWARGQSWAIYGYTMVYRATRDKRFLNFAEKVTDVYLERLPEDLIPYWDFDVPNILNEPKDASAAAVTASALLELSTYINDLDKAAEYRTQAEQMLGVLSTESYQSREQNPAFLMHSTGHYPNGSEIDASIIYADYYYVEALLRLYKLQKDQPVVDSVLTDRND
jgi:unsaturated chondroitin disaccharide hydrolase